MVRYTKHAELEVFDGELSEHRYPWHYHACYTIIVVKRGSIVYQFQDTSIRVGGSEVLVVEPYHVHRNMIAQPTTYSAIFVPRDQVERAGTTTLATQRSARPDVHQKAVALVQCCKLPQDQVRGIVETHNTPELWDNEKEQMDGSADRSDAARA